MSFENYPVEMERLGHPDITACKDDRLVRELTA